MAGTAFTNPVGGFWPLGLITVAVAGTPIPLNTNVGPTKGGALQMAKRARQLIFSNAKIGGGVAGNIFVCKKGYNKNNTNGVLLVIPVPAGGPSPLPQSLPNGALLQNAQVTPDDIQIDSDVAASSIQVTAIYG